MFGKQNNQLLQLNEKKPPKYSGNINFNHPNSLFSRALEITESDFRLIYSGQETYNIEHIIFTITESSAYVSIRPTNYANVRAAFHESNIQNLDWYGHTFSIDFDLVSIDAFFDSFKKAIEALEGGNGFIKECQNYGFKNLDLEQDLKYIKGYLQKSKSLIQLAAIKVAKLYQQGNAEDKVLISSVFAPAGPHNVLPVQ